MPSSYSEGWIAVSENQRRAWAEIAKVWPKVQGLKEVVHMRDIHVVLPRCEIQRP
jgi:hypothetical protein